MVFISETITLESIIKKACSFNPEDRYPGCGEVLKDLNSIGRTTRCLSPEDVQDIVNANKKKKTRSRSYSLKNNYVECIENYFFSTIKQGFKNLVLGSLLCIPLLTGVYIYSSVASPPVKPPKPPVVYPTKATDSSSRQAPVYLAPIVAQARNAAEAVVAQNPFSERIYPAAEQSTGLAQTISASEVHADDADSFFQNARQYVRTADSLAADDATDLYRNAAEYMKKAIRIKPGNSEYHYYLGKLYAKKFIKDWPVLAAKELKAAVALDPGNAAYHNKLGDVYYSAQSLSGIRKAIPQYESAVRLNPDMCLYHINLGKAYYRNYQVNDAAGQFELALKLDTSMHSTAKRWFDIAMNANAQDDANSKGDGIEDHISE